MVSLIDTDEESDLLFIDKLLPDLKSSYVVDDRMYCFHTGGNQVDQLKTFGLAIKDSQQLMSPMCVADHRSIRYPTGIQDYIHFKESYSSFILY